MHLLTATIMTSSYKSNCRRSGIKFWFRTRIKIKIKTQPSSRIRIKIKIKIKSRIESKLGRKTVRLS